MSEAQDRVRALIAELRDRYSEPVVPPCRICGGPLSIERCGGDSPTIWRCTGRTDDGYAPGRKMCDAHYENSEWADRRAGGDERVIALCDEADVSDDLYRSIKVRLGQTPGDGQLPHAAIDAMERRAVEAEADIVALVRRIQRIADDYIPDRDDDAPLAMCQMMSALNAAICDTADRRAILDRLERAESDRDALQAGASKLLEYMQASCPPDEYGHDPEHESESVFDRAIRVLRARRKDWKDMKARTAERCSRRIMWDDGECPRTCSECHGSGAVIVEGD